MMASEPTSIEQTCRDILTLAIADGIVTFNTDNFEGTDDPQSMTSGDLCGVANLLQARMRRDFRAQILAALTDKEREAVANLSGGPRTMEQDDCWMHCTCALLRLLKDTNHAD